MGGKKGLLGTPSSTVQTDKRRKSQRSAARRKQDKKWASMNGPVITRKIEDEMNTEQVVSVLKNIEYQLATQNLIGLAQLQIDSGHKLPINRLSHIAERLADVAPKDQ